MAYSSGRTRVETKVMTKTILLFSVLCQVNLIRLILINPAADTMTTAARAAKGIKPINLEKSKMNTKTLNPEKMAEKRVLAPLTTLTTVRDGEPDEGMH